MSTVAPPSVPARVATDAIVAALTERRLAFKVARKRFRRDRDPDALHDLRVALRRFRAALSLFGPLLVTPRRARDAQLRQLGHALAPLRDADVVRGALSGTEALAIGVDERALERADSRRKDALVRAREALRRRRVRRAMIRFRRWERRPRFAVEPEARIGAVLHPRLLAHAEIFAAHPAWRLKLRRDQQGRLQDAEGALDGEGVNSALHSLRRGAKRLRYELELAAPLLGLDEAGAVAYLHEIQDALGELQDVRVVEAAVEALPAAEAPGAAFAAWLRERRYRALERWRRLRRDRAASVLAMLREADLPATE